MAGERDQTGLARGRRATRSASGGFGIFLERVGGLTQFAIEHALIIPHPTIIARLYSKAPVELTRFHSIPHLFLPRACIHILSSRSQIQHPNSHGLQASIPLAMGRQNPNIIITGTPGVGKTTHAEQLATSLGFTHVSINQIVKDEGFHEGKDEELGSWVVDEDRVRFSFHVLQNE
jgi:hypothetical protein